MKKILTDQYKRHCKDYNHDTGQYKTDTFYIITGDEGVGKTTLAQQCGNFFIPLILQDFCWNPMQVLDRFNKYRGRPVIIDEGIIGSALDYNKKEVKAMTHKLTKIRSKGLFIFWLIPNLFDLDHRIVRRAKGWFHVYKKNPDTVNEVYGYVRFFPRKLMHKIYVSLKGTTDGRLNKVPMTRGVPFNFNSSWVVDEREYERLKDKNTQDEIKGLLGSDNDGFQDILKCPDCNRTDTRYVKGKNMLICKKCGCEWSKEGNGVENVV